MRKAGFIGAIVLVGTVVLACGSTTSNNAPGADAGGNDATTPNEDSGGNVGVDGGEDGATLDDGGQCVPGDADISTLNPVDASLNDAGASVGTCVGCAKTKCATGVSACNADCTCNNSLSCTFNCIGGVGNSLLSCAGQCGISSLAALDPAEKALLLCAFQQCKAECGQGGTTTTTDGGADSGDLDADIDAADLDAADQ
jgi:hypothetical protein